MDTKSRPHLVTQEEEQAVEEESGKRGGGGKMRYERKKRELTYSHTMLYLIHNLKGVYYETK